ncbi:hypothetical protein C5167_048966 [Papaver somniferum]|uniref:Uncharacterized protein n=1 Tax=Papaver somniferum TaxID=3469 RepID=A0A4Y7KKU1_PAPSO|nr:hypothetical protein C5167_048966 [Papaver somniferum]
MAALVTLRDLLQKNIKCRNLLENDADGGSFTGSVVKYQPYASDPNQPHPALQALSADLNQVYLYTTTPQQAFKDLSIESEFFNLMDTLGTSSRKKRKVSEFSKSDSSSLEPIQKVESLIDEENFKNGLSKHFNVLQDVKKNEKLRKDLALMVSSIRSYQEYKRQKKKNNEGSKKEKGQIKIA